MAIAGWQFWERKKLLDYTRFSVAFISVKNTSKHGGVPHHIKFNGNIIYYLLYAIALINIKCSVVSSLFVGHTFSRFSLVSRSHIFKCSSK